jgi:hypothetical protein
MTAPGWFTSNSTSKHKWPSWVNLGGLCVIGILKEFSDRVNSKQRVKSLSAKHPPGVRAVSGSCRFSNKMRHSVGSINKKTREPIMISGG